MEIKKVLVASKFARGSMGINTWKWNTFPYLVQKSEKSLGIGEPTFHAKKTATTQIALKKGCSTWNQMISLNN